MPEKTCRDCKELKPASEFYKKKDYTDGLFPYCKICQNIRSKKAMKKYLNTEKGKKTLKEYEDSGRKNEYLKKYRASEKVKKKISEASLKYYFKNIDDPLFKTTHRIRGLIRSSLKRYNYSKNSRTAHILGVEFDEFREYIEGKFEKNMSWDNHGEWELDHIIPISSAKNIQEIYDLNYFLNFQPLWENENIQKKNKYDLEDKLKMLKKIRLHKKNNKIK